MSRLTLVGLALTACLALLVQAGCLLAPAANLLNAAGLNMTPARYEGLRDQTVAVVVETEASLFREDPAANELSLRLGGTLTEEVKKLKLIRPSKLREYRDEHGYDPVDLEEFGIEVGADRVVHVRLNNLSLRGGINFFKGSTDAIVTVIDPGTGLIEHTEEISGFTFPQNAGIETTSTSEERFRKLYLSILAQRIGRLFHPFDPNDLAALDSKIASFR
ncbi:MAG: hypothetical protein AAF664_10685 [Planctomycetota bacterium]